MSYKNENMKMIELLEVPRWRPGDAHWLHS